MRIRMTNIVGRLCRTPWRFTETPYNPGLQFSMTIPIQIKICGVTNVGDAKACVELGAHLIGLNFYRQSPRYIEPEVARQIVETIPASVHAVGVFVDANDDEVRNVANLAGIHCVQLHGNCSPEMAHELAREFRVIRAFSTHARFRPEEI